MKLNDVLTTRGRGFLAAGLTLIVCGLGLGFVDLTRIGVLLTALPLMAAFLARRSRPEVRISRHVTPSRLSVDDVARVRLRFVNDTSRAAPLQLADERVDEVLGPRPRFVLPRMDPGDARELVYQVRSQARGRHRIGPLSLRVRDPFGLATASVRTAGTTELLVLPRVEPLGGSRPRGNGVGAEGEIPHMVALHGEDDVSIRGYRDGDDLRRIHWPATAHRGMLMVRQEDRPARRRAVLVLDSRAIAHAGSGPIRSFEWAVSAVASVAVHLSGQGYAVHLLCAETVHSHGAAETVDIDTTLAALAVATEASGGSFDQVLHTAHSLASSGGLVVAFVTDHDEEAIRQVATLRQPGGSGLLLLLDAASFAADGRSRRTAASRAEPKAGPGDPSTAAQGLADLAMSAGWSAVVVRGGMTVDDAWSTVSASAAARGRSPMPPSPGPGRDPELDLAGAPS